MARPNINIESCGLPFKNFLCRMGLRTIEQNAQTKQVFFQFLLSIFGQTDFRVKHQF